MNQDINILGLKISSIVYEDVLNKVIYWLRNKKPAYICVASVNLVMKSQSNQNLLKGVNKADLVTADGMPLVWISKIYGAKNIARVYGPTLMLKLCDLARKKHWNIFLLGGKEKQSQVLKQNLLKKFPNLNIVGHLDTPNRHIPIKQIQQIRQIINSSKADIVFVGLGCPWQELWMIENRKYLKPQVLIGVGAAFDFISGYVKQAPVWIQNMGMEWLFRLFQEPGRLWQRYLVVNTQFIIKISRQLIYDFLLNRYNRHQ